jgi:hypothetical protein
MLFTYILTLIIYKIFILNLKQFLLLKIYLILIKIQVDKLTKIIKSI